MVQRRITWAGLATLLLLLLLAACTPPGQEAVSGELSLLCTPQVEWCEGMKAEFEAKYPSITVNFVRMSSGESLTRLRNEKDNPQFDIWWGGPIDSFVAAKQEGLLEKYETKSQDKIINKDLMLDADKYWVGIYVGSLGFATNTTSGITPPTSWDELLSPELKGQVIVAHPSSSGTSYTALCSVLQIRGEEAGWDYLRQYAGQVNQFTKSGAAPARFAGQGEAAVAIVFSHDIVAQIEAGLPLALTFPAEAPAMRSAAWASSKAPRIWPRPNCGTTGLCSRKRRNWGPSTRPIKRPPSKAPRFPARIARGEPDRLRL